MILVANSKIGQSEVEEIVNRLKEWGATKVSVSTGENKCVIGIIGDKTKLMTKPLTTLKGVEKVIEVSAPYKLASREFQASNSEFNIGGIKVGNGNRLIIAGPCSVDTYDYVLETAIAVKKAGANMLRGGAFKPRTSPYSFQGHGEDGLKILADARAETSLPIVTEVMSESDIEIVCKYADVIQIGARNMQNFSLLREIGKAGKPTILKNGIASTVQEHLMSAEYLMSEGLEEVILCLRGVRSYESAMRNVIDLNLIPYMQKLTHLPIIVDPSHAAGKREFVSSLSYGGMAMGADGLIVEVHPNPSCALSDGDQALLPRDFDYLMNKLNALTPWSQEDWNSFTKN